MFLIITIENIGISKTIEKAKSANIILHLLEANTNIKNQLKNLKNISTKETLVVINKTDLNMSSTSEKVTAIIVDKLGVDEAEVTNEASFTNDLGADSLDTVELIMEFEKEFDIQIPDDKAESITTVGDAILFIEESS